MKRRRPLIALLLSFLGTGIGQLYNGQLKTAVFFCVLIWTLGFLCLAGFLKSFALGSMLLCLSVLAFVWSLMNAFSTARALGEIQLKAYNRWYLYAILITGLGLTKSAAGDYVKQNYLEAFVFPSSSMEATILPGDRILVDKRFYRSHRPKRGDIVVFVLPDDSATEQVDESKINILKRIAAIGGDTVEIKEAKLSINGRVVDEPYVRGEKAGSADFGPLTVPEGKVFLLGDNRNHSRDSRYWDDPFVSVSSICGKALYAYWPINRMGVGF